MDVLISLEQVHNCHSQLCFICIKMAEGGVKHAFAWGIRIPKLDKVNLMILADFILIIAIIKSCYLRAEEGIDLPAFRGY